MKVKIINAVTEVILPVRGTSFVAEVKARYAAADGFVGDPARIQLAWRGRVLQDLHCLLDYGLTDGAVISHVLNEGPHREAVDYRAVASHLAIAHEQALGGRRGDPREFTTGTWDPAWTGEYDRMPPVLVGSTGISRDDLWDGPVDIAMGGTDDDAPPPARGAHPAGPAAAAVTAPAVARLRAARAAKRAIVVRGSEHVVAFGDTRAEVNIRPPARFFRHVYVAQVGDFMFRALHTLEGRWTGDADVYLAGQRSTAETRVCTVSLVFDDMEGVWRETQSLTTREGMVVSQSMTLRPCGDGVCTVEFDAPPGEASSSSGGGRGGGHSSPPAPSRLSRAAAFMHSHGGVSAGGGLVSRDYSMTLKELSEHMLVLTATSRVTQRPLLLETITLMSDMARVRTVQRFDEEGNFQCIYTFREERVLDSVTGAMMEPPRRVPRSEHVDATPTANGQSAAAAAAAAVRRSPMITSRVADVFDPAATGAPPSIATSAAATAGATGGASGTPRATAAGAVATDTRV